VTIEIDEVIQYLFSAVPKIMVLVSYEVQKAKSVSGQASYQNRSVRLSAETLSV
jgi:hypothetical protein